MIRPVWIEVDLKALEHNFKFIRKIIKNNVKIVATVKQSAYGHGIIPIARKLSRLGVDCFGVASLEEAIFLRDAGFKEPILVLSAVFESYAEYFVKYKVTATVVSLDFARRLDKLAKKIGVVHPVHIYVDTGMGRLGHYYKDSFEFIEKIKNLKNIFLEGIYTHFPVADSDLNFTGSQIKAFNEFINLLKNKAITFKYRHCANSIGMLNYPKAHFNMVRPGLVLYGGMKFKGVGSSVLPILSLKSKVIFIKRFKPGMSASYGRNFVAKKATLIATVSVGYADGYPWSLSNKAKVIIKDAFFPLAGNVCMDHIMVDLGNRRDISVGDDVILIGKSGKLEIMASDLADWAQTIPYEIMSRLSLKIQRDYKPSLLPY
ncbi:MAG: alanine racemase [Candidatus Omnitrophica bacterium]|nr:alanine racemase [Candidatus Omnitrophota bacterium]